MLSTKDNNNHYIYNNYILSLIYTTIDPNVQ